MATGAYSFEMKFTAVREDAPDDVRKSAPETSDALNAAVEAAREQLKAHGFIPVHSGYGSRRLEVT